MSATRVLGIALRVVRQVWRDRRTVALVFLVPVLVLALGAALFRSGPPVLAVGVVIEDRGLPVPGVGLVVFAESVAERLAAAEGFSVVRLEYGEIDERLGDDTVQGVVHFPANFSLQAHTGEAAIDLRLEGTSPATNAAITWLVNRAVVEALMLSRLPEGRGPDSGLPVQVHDTYLYAGKEYDTLDYVAPLYVGFVAMFFVFLLTCVSFLRERVHGTMERLLSTPVTRLDLMLGYVIGLGLFAQFQVFVILLFTTGVLKIRYAGSLALLFVVVVVLALVGLSLGILASAFARNEFQVVQFIPLLIIPQALLGGTVWPVEELPGHLRYVAYCLPLTYANRALRDVMLRGAGLEHIWGSLTILAGFFGLFMTLGVLATRRQL